MRVDPEGLTEPSEARRRIMRAVKSRDTGPEMRVRRLLHAEGYRYRLHCKDLPGHPDLVFPGRRKVVFVHGCFWHGHGCARGKRVPKENRSYWVEKIAGNRSRDRKVAKLLRESGWERKVVWECNLKNMDRVRAGLIAFLG